MTDARGRWTVPSRGRILLAAAMTVPLATAAATALTGTGRVIFTCGAVVGASTALGRWRAPHGAAAAVALTLILQAPLAGLLAPPIRHLVPDLAFTIRSAEPGIRDGSIVTTDARGFRPTTTAPPSDPSRRLVLIGGSTTEQLYVDDRATTAWLLADRLGGSGSDTEVLNTGLSGLRARDHLNHIQFFSRDARDFDDTHLVIMLGINDWNRLASIHVHGDEVRPERPRWRDVDEFPITRLVITSRVRQLRAEDGRLVEFPHRGSYETSSRSDVSGQELQLMLDDWQRSLDELIIACAAGPRLRCTFVTQPTVFTVENMRDPGIRETISMDRGVVRALTPEALILVSSSFNRTLIETVESSDCHSCAVIDADAALGGDPTLFYDECHFTEAGAAALADALIDGGILAG